MDKRKKLKLLEDFFNSKAFESQIIMQLDELFLMINYNKAMVYASVDGETELIKLDNYLKLLPESWNSLEGLFGEFLDKGKEITLAELVTQKDLYSLEQFKSNKNLKEKINWSFYSITVLSFKENIRRVFLWGIIFYLFVFGVFFGINLLGLTKEKIQTSEIITGSIIIEC